MKKLLLFLLIASAVRSVAQVPKRFVGKWTQDWMVANWNVKEFLLIEPTTAKWQIDENLTIVLRPSMKGDTLILTYVDFVNKPETWHAMETLPTNKYKGQIMAKCLPGGGSEGMGFGIAIKLHYGIPQLTNFLTSSTEFYPKYPRLPQKLYRQATRKPAMDTSMPEG